MTKSDTQFGADLIGALEEVRAHRQGKIALPTRLVQGGGAAVRELRKRHAKSPKEFERRFGIPARTMEGWEQGRKLAASDRIFLAVIDRAPEAVEQVVRELAEI